MSLTTSEVQDKLTALRAPAFDPMAHQYSYDGKELVSVSSLIGKFKRPFDARANATRVAQREGRMVEDVLAQWDAKRDAAMLRGKQVHAEIERALEPLLGKRCAEIDSDAEDPLAAAALDWLSEWRDAELVAQEQPIALPDYGLAGTFDCLVRAPNGELVLLDWKTNGELRLRADPRWSDCRMLAPVAHLDDVHGSHYALQLSAYALILEGRYGLTIDRCAILHLGPEGATAHVMPDLRGEVRDLLCALRDPRWVKNEVPW